MIEANQLRVGNLVNEKVLGDVPVDSIGQKSSWVVTKHMKQDNTISDVIYHINNSELFPIPLTPEVLIACGFREGMENAGTLPCFIKSKYTIAKHGVDRWQFWISTVDIYNSPQYLHQLQNLFWCLTGEELTVNL